MIFENASLFFKKLKKILLCPCFPFPDLLTAEFPRCRIRVFWKSSRRGPLFPRGNMCRRHAGKAVARMKSGGIRVRQQYARRQGSSAQAKRRHAGKAAATGKTKAAVSRRAARIPAARTTRVHSRRVSSGGVLHAEALSGPSRVDALEKARRLDTRFPSAPPGMSAGRQPVGFPSLPSAFRADFLIQLV